MDVFATVSCFEVATKTEFERRISRASRSHWCRQLLIALVRLFFRCGPNKKILRYCRMKTEAYILHECRDHTTSSNLTTETTEGELHYEYQRASALLDHAPAVYHIDPVRRLHRGQPVRDDDCRATRLCHDRIERRLLEMFRCCPLH